MAIHPPDTDLERVHPTNYIIRRIDLGKQTHEGMVEDAQTSFQHLVTTFNEEKVKKDKLKKQVDQITEVPIKITKSSEVVEPVTFSVDEQIFRQVEQVNSHGRIVGEWMDRLVIQRTRLLCSVVTLVNNLEEVKIEIDKTLNLFSNELEAHEKDFNSWLKLEDFQLDILVDNEVIPSRECTLRNKRYWKIR